MILTNEELFEIKGGNISSTFVNSLTKGINTLLDLGRSIGSAIRRITTKNVCPL